MDDFFVQGGLGIADPLLYEKENEEQLKEQVISGYIKALKDTAAQGATKANQNNKAKPATRYQREMQQVENLFVNAQQNVVDNLTSLYKTQAKTDRLLNLYLIYLLKWGWM